MYSVIFDMDGTLLDTQKICIPAWEYAGGLQGIQGLGSEVKNVCGMNKAGWTSFLREHYPELDADLFNEQMRRYIIENQVIRYKEGALELLEYLKKNGVKMAVASGSSRESVNHHLNEVGADKYITTSLGGQDVKFGKPSPDIFLLAAEKLDANPSDCYVFEDSPNGVRAAVAAGMKCFGVPDIADFSSDIEALLYAKISRLDEAIGWLKTAK